jgi:large repetitive protein
MTTAVEQIPAITKVTDSNGDILQGGTTKDTAVSVMGRSVAEQKVSLYKNGIPVFSINADSNGNWVGRLTGLAVGAQAITAKSGENMSSPWSFTVALPK